MFYICGMKKQERKYNSNFIRDVKWYLKMRNTFNFDGSGGYYDKMGDSVIRYDKNGVSGIEAFFKWDSNGVIVGTRHPNILRAILKTKGAINLQIKLWAQGRADGTLPLVEFSKRKAIEYKKRLTNNEYEITQFKEMLSNRVVNEWVKVNGQMELVSYSDIEEQYNLLDWIVDAVENQKIGMLCER